MFSKLGMKKANDTSSVKKQLDDFATGYPHIFDRKRRLLFSFVEGCVYGSGFILAMAMAIPITVLVLRYVEWVPIVGEFVTEVLEWMHDFQQGGSAR